MSTFAETAIVDYRLLFADQGKQTSKFHYSLQQTNGSFQFPLLFAANKWKLPIPISCGCSICIYMLRFKRKMEAQAIFS
jgi:hypothetical protein